MPGGSCARLIKVWRDDRTIALAKLNDTLRARITHEANALSFLGNSSDLPVPDVLASTSDALLLEWIDGKEASHVHSDVFWQNFGAILARLHSVGTRASALKYSSDPLELGARLVKGLEAQVKRVEDSDLRSLADSALSVLARNGAGLENPHLFTHRDLRLENILVTADSEVAAILDFESAASADPAWDFVKLHWWVLPTPRESAFCRGYETIGPVPEHERIRLFALHESASMLSYFEHRNDAYIQLAAATIRRLI